MAGFPWPLDGVQKWFEGLWNWISKAAVTAVSVVSGWIDAAVTAMKKAVTDTVKSVSGWITDAVTALKKAVTDTVKSVSGWITDAVSGLSKTVTDWFTQIWGWISDAVTAAQKAITDAVGGVSSWITDAVSGLSKTVTDWFTQIWKWISDAVDTAKKAITDTVSGVWTSVSGAFGDLWTATTDFLTRFWKDVSGSIGAVGGAVMGAVTTIGNWVSDAMKGVAAALGLALQVTFDWLWKGLTTVSGIIVNGLNEYVVKPLLGAFDWIRDSIIGVLRSLYDSLLGTLKAVGAGTPEGVAALAVPLLLISSSGSFAVGAMGAVTGIKVMGTGADTGGIVDCLKDAFNLNEVSQSIFKPLLGAAYVQPITYYYNAMFRPRIPDTRTADQMLFEENIGEPEWRQIYRYNGWKEQHIDAWFKTMWREPSLLILRNLLLDPDTPEAWVRKKMREGGLIGEDADAMVDYGRRQSLKDERSAMATQVQTDFVDGVIIEADARADLGALKFNPAEIDYRIARCTLIVARNERRAALKAVKNFTEADLKQEVALGLRTHGQFSADMQTIGFSAAIAERKYTLIITAKPVTAAELERRKTVITDKIVKATRRFDMLIARHDLQTGLIADTIDYLSSLEKPPDVRIASLMLQLNKAADEKQLILEERDAELADLQTELSFIQAG